jgi:hypothetical protein
MSSGPNELWSAWRSSADIRGLAEGLITKPAGEWSSDDDDLYGILHSDPDRALSVIFAAMQLTDDQRVLAASQPDRLRTFSAFTARPTLRCSMRWHWNMVVCARCWMGSGRAQCQKTYGTGSRH